MKRRDLEKKLRKDGWQYTYSTGGHDHFIHPVNPAKSPLVDIHPMKLHPEHL